MNPLRIIQDLVFPPLCFSCKERLENNTTIICADCSRELHWLQNVCPICGNKLEMDICSYCRSNHWYFDKTVSLFAYSRVVQKLIHALKYEDMIKVAKLFQEYLTQFLKKKLAAEEIDLVTPVPIHRVRKRSRGYNQAELISNRVADILKLQHLPHLLKRKTYTKTQTKLSRDERKLNVSEAFSLRKNIDLNSKTVLLIDDVFTTGATVNSISKLLKENGSKKVIILTISHA